MEKSGIKELQITAMKWIQENKLEGEYLKWNLKPDSHKIPWTLIDFVIQYDIDQAKRSEDFKKEVENAKNDLMHSC